MHVKLLCNIYTEIDRGLAGDGLDIVEALDIDSDSEFL